MLSVCPSAFFSGGSRILESRCGGARGRGGELQGINKFYYLTIFYKIYYFYYNIGLRSASVATKLSCFFFFFYYSFSFFPPLSMKGCVNPPRYPLDPSMGKGNP